MDSRSRFRANFNRDRSDVPTHQPLATHEAVPTHHAPETKQEHHTPEHKPTETTHHTKKTKKLGLFFGRKWPLVVIVILALGLIGLGYGYINTKNELNNTRNNPEAAGQTEIEKLTSSVGKTIKLPTETPTLATVTNVEQLKNQEFFKDAKNGDKVLIFTKSGRALLYRPSTKLVIEYARVNLDNQ